MSELSRSQRVFISYSHDSDRHREAVHALARDLSDLGFTVIIDVDDPVPREGWAVWCSRQVERADYILCVCTETYRRRVSGDEPHGVGRGATFEGRLIATQILKGDRGHDTVLPVLLPGASERQIPLVLQPGSVFRVPDALT